MSITIGTVNKDGTGATLAVKVPMHGYHTAATTTSSHTGCRWGFFKATNFTYNQITGNVTGPGGGSRFAYYNHLNGAQIELEHPDVNGGVAQLVTILSKVNNNAVAVSTAYHGSSLINVTAYVGIEPLADLVYKWDCPGAATYTNTDPDPTGLRSSTIDTTKWYGPHTVCHHYEAAGTHIITLTVNDYANGESASKTITVTATTNTWTTRYLDPAGSDANLGTSAGVGNAWQTWKKGEDWVFGGADRELILATGTYPDLTANPANLPATANHHYIHHDGVGSKPIIPCKGFIAFQCAGTVENMRMVGISFTKDTNSAESGVLNAMSWKDSIVLRCDVTTSVTDTDCITMTGNDSNERSAIIDCNLTATHTGAGGSYVIFGGGGTTTSEATGRCVVACVLTGGSDTIMRTYTFRSIYAYNKHRSLYGNAPQLRLHDAAGYTTGETYVWRCYLKNDWSAIVSDGIKLDHEVGGVESTDIIDSCYIDGGTNGVTNAITNLDKRNNCVVRNCEIINYVTLYHNQLNFSRRWRFFNNSAFSSMASAKGWRAGGLTTTGEGVNDGGIDDLYLLNNILSITGAVATPATPIEAVGYGWSNTGNTAYPDRDSAFVDYNLFHLTDADCSLGKVRTWTTAASSTAATYTDGAGVTRTLTEAGAWTAFTWTSGDRARPTGVVPQHAENNMRLIGSKTSNDIIVIGGGAGAGWGQDYASVPCDAQDKSDTNVAQLSNWTTIKPAETHNLGGVGAFSLSPQFNDPANGDLTLQVGSPCRATGLALPCNARDYVGNMRFTGSGETADMGAIAYAIAEAAVASSGTSTTAIAAAIASRRGGRRRGRR